MKKLGMVLLATACTRSNPDHCDVNADCADGLICALPSHACVLPADAGFADAPNCFGTSLLPVCPTAALMGTVTLSGPFDTGDANTTCSGVQLWKSGNTKSCFVVADSITVMDLKVTGPRPLVFVANTVTVLGHLDLASRVADAKIGPASDGLAFCGTFGGNLGSNGAGGGGGATFAAPGKKGGTGGAGAAGSGGTTPLPDFITLPPDTLRAGCRGQTGGAGTGAGGSGGYGGGALYIAAAQNLTLGPSALVDACGAGAGQAGKEAGGGGGGSGGMIILYAGSFSIANGAIIVANGGSGSTGGTMPGVGTIGVDPDPTTPGTPSHGPTTSVASGGDGFAQSGSTVLAATSGGSTSATASGGGGGGGAGGYIQVNMVLANATTSPATSVVP